MMHPQQLIYPYVPMSSGGMGTGLGSQGSNRIDYVMRATVKSNNTSWGVPQ